MQKHINSICKKREDKPLLLFLINKHFWPLSTVLLFFLPLSIDQPTPECHTKRSFSHGVKTINMHDIWTLAKLANITLHYEGIV